jgi:hypothetical protein
MTISSKLKLKALERNANSFEIHHSASFFAPIECFASERTLAKSTTPWKPSNY